MRKKLQNEKKRPIFSLSAYIGIVWQLAIGGWLLAGLVGLFDWLEALAVCIGFLS